MSRRLDIVFDESGTLVNPGNGYGYFTSPWYDTQGLDLVRIAYSPSSPATTYTIDDSPDGVNVLDSRNVIQYGDVPLVGRYVRIRLAGAANAAFRVVCRAVQ